MHELDPKLHAKAESILRYKGSCCGPSYLESKVKRLLDLLVTSSASPFAAGIALAGGVVVALDDGHWPYVNLGLTKDDLLEKDINWWKIRTMVCDARQKEFDYVGNETLNSVKGKVKDERITRVGKFIRATHLDDSPLAFNVFKGDISLVGPRLFSLSEWQKDFKPNKELEPYKGFVDLLQQGMKFGVTGMFLILRNESDISFKDRVLLDVYYGRNANLAADLKIIALTLPQLSKPSG